MLELTIPEVCCSATKTEHLTGLLNTLMFGLKPLSSSRHSGSTIPCECLKWTGRCCSFVDCIGVVISLLAGNCLPYHQPFSITHNPCMCCSLPVKAPWFEGRGFACMLPWGSYYRPPLFTPSLTRSIWWVRRVVTVPALNHSFSHAFCPTDFGVGRSIGRLPYQVPSSFRPPQRVENRVEYKGALLPGELSWRHCQRC